MSKQSRRAIAVGRECRWLIALVLVGAFSLGACGGSSSSASTKATSHPNATTTMPKDSVAPPPPNAAAVSSYLSSPTNAFMAFERATSSLTNGIIPSKKSCEELAKSLSGQAEASPDAVMTSIRGISDIAIQVAANQDVQNRLLLLTTCIHGTATREAVVAAQGSASVVAQELKGLGITLSAQGATS
jgi:hypothetical protein